MYRARALALLVVIAAVIAACVGCSGVHGSRNRSQIIEDCFAILDTHWVTGRRCWNDTHSQRFKFPWAGKCQDYGFFRPSAGAGAKYASAQWLWDSQLADLVMAHRNVSRSITDLRGLVSMQLDGAYDANFDGMIPEIISWPQTRSEKSNLLNLAYYGNNDVALNSQMPVAAWNLEAIYRATGDKAVVRELLPKLAKYHRWWRTRQERDPATGRILSSCPSILHGWESGLDASPSYDEAYNVGTPTPTQSQMYPQFLTLMVGYELNFQWNLTRILNRAHAAAVNPTPLQRFLMNDAYFYVQDVGLCAVLAHTSGVLARLADEVGDSALAATLRSQEQELTEAIVSKHWDAKNNRFASRWRRPDGSFALAAANTVQNLFPLLLNIPDRLFSIVLNTQLLNPSKFWFGGGRVQFPVPSCAADDPSFNASYSEGDDLMWRGSTWGATSYFVALALAEGRNRTERLLWPRHRAMLQREAAASGSAPDLLSVYIERWVQMISNASATAPPETGALGKTGIFEMYDPTTGAGQGVAGLGMSTLAADLLIRFG